MPIADTESFARVQSPLRWRWATSTPTLDDGCRKREFAFRFAEALHDGFFFFAGKPSVQQPYFQFGKTCLKAAANSVHRRLQFQLILR